jgi:hypothetical protein
VCATLGTRAAQLANGDLDPNGGASGDDGVPRFLFGGADGQGDDGAPENPSVPSLMTNATLLAADEGGPSGPARMALANDWLSYLLMVIGWFLVLGAALNYWKVVRYARAMREAQPSA